MCFRQFLQIEKKISKIALARFKTFIYSYYARANPDSWCNSGSRKLWQIWPKSAIFAIFGHFARSYLWTGIEILKIKRQKLRTLYRLIIYHKLAFWLVPPCLQKISNLTKIDIFDRNSEKKTKFLENRQHLFSPSNGIYFSSPERNWAAKLVNSFDRLPLIAIN